MSVDTRVLSEGKMVYYWDSESMSVKSSEIVQFYGVFGVLLASGHNAYSEDLHLSFDGLQKATTNWIKENHDCDISNLESQIEDIKKTKEKILGALDDYGKR